MIPREERINSLPGPSTLNNLNSSTIGRYGWFLAKNNNISTNLCPPPPYPLPLSHSPPGILSPSSAPSMWCCFQFCCFDPKNRLVGGFNPFEKYMKSMILKLDHFPNFRGEKKNIWNHHPAVYFPAMFAGVFAESFCGALLPEHRSFVSGQPEDFRVSRLIFPQNLVGFQPIYANIWMTKIWQSFPKQWTMMKDVVDIWLITFDLKPRKRGDTESICFKMLLSIDGSKIRAVQICINVNFGRILPTASNMCSTSFKRTRQEPKLSGKMLYWKFIGAKFHCWANLPPIIRSNRRYQYSNFLGRTKMPTELTTNLDISEPSALWSLDFWVFCELLRDLIWELPRTPIRLHRSRHLFG